MHGDWLISYSSGGKTVLYKSDGRSQRRGHGGIEKGVEHPPIEGVLDSMRRYYFIEPPATAGRRGATRRLYAEHTYSIMNKIYLMPIAMSGNRTHLPTPRMSDYARALPNHVSAAIAANENNIGLKFARFKNEDRSIDITIGCDRQSCCLNVRYFPGDQGRRP